MCSTSSLGCLSVKEPHLFLIMTCCTWIPMSLLLISLYTDFHPYPHYFCFLPPRLIEEPPVCSLYILRSSLSTSSQNPHPSSDCIRACCLPSACLSNIKSQISAAPATPDHTGPDAGIRKIYIQNIKSYTWPAVGVGPRITCALEEVK